MRDTRMHKPLLRRADDIACGYDENSHGRSAYPQYRSIASSIIFHADNKHGIFLDGVSKRIDIANN